jgi:hypothetical protein
MADYAARRVSILENCVPELALSLEPGAEDQSQPWWWAGGLMMKSLTRFQANLDRGLDDPPHRLDVRAVADVLYERQPDGAVRLAVDQVGFRQQPVG